MITSFIGLKELRGRLTQVALRARKERRRYIVLRKNEPLFELRPISKKDATLEQLQQALKKAEEDIRKGNLYSQKEVEKMLNL